MSRTTGAPRKQQLTFPCLYCDAIFKKNSQYVLHAKEKHGVEL